VAIPHEGRVLLTTDGYVATITLDRPAKLNALTPEMLDQLEAAVAAVDADQSVRVAVLASSGDRVFCAGADIKRFSVLDGAQMWAAWTRRGHQVFDRLDCLRQPTIAAIDGDAYGGGFELAMACDLRILADSASLGLTEVGLGTVPGWGGTQRLPQLVGAARAKYALFTGAPIVAADAFAWGLANELAPAPEVHAAAGRLAKFIATRAPVAVQLAKQAVDLAGTAGAGVAIEGMAAAASAGVDDFAEGLSAFLTRRAPEFTGINPTPTSEGHEGS
jgi:enoyl-CoA hydratase/carnithine racemase